MIDTNPVCIAYYSRAIHISGCCLNDDPFMIERKFPRMETEEDNSDKSFHFPDEILLEILLKLPFKSLSRFRCVSKNWHSLISDATFFPCFVSQSNDSPPFTLIFQSDKIHALLAADDILKNFDSTFPSDQIPGLKIEATSNDLVLYRSHGQESAYFVANPFTRQSVRIPPHSGRSSCGYTGLISSVRNGIAGYNIARVIKDHEVQHCTYDKLCLNLEMFSSEKGEWMYFREIDCDFDVQFDASPCIVCNGVLHWICNKMTALLAYDSSSDQCRFISLPREAYYMNGMNAILGVSRENLCYFEMISVSIEGCNLPGWKLWEMDCGKGEWRLKHEAKERKIEASGVLNTVLSTYSPLLPLAFHPWNNNVVYFWYEGFILAFNTKRGWFEEKFSTISLISMWEIFPLLMLFCPSRILEMK